MKAYYRINKVVLLPGEGCTGRITEVKKKKKRGREKKKRDRENNIMA